jgi:signal transduction histidine kinase
MNITPPPPDAPALYAEEAPLARAVLAAPDAGAKAVRRTTGEALALWLAARAKALNELGGWLPGSALVPLAWGLVVLIAAADLAMGFEITLRFLYCIPVVLLAAARGTKPAVMMALLCDGCWLAADLVAGANYSSLFVPIANMLITLGVYLVIIWLLGGLLSLHREMERRVDERTQALTAEMATRTRLEREIVNISEKERWSLGHDLHDGLGQHFTATAMAAQSLARGLEDEGHAASGDAYRLVKFIEDGIGQTRRLAKGLLLVSVGKDGLSDALREMATASAEQFRVPCESRLAGDLEVADSIVATNLFRIAQEAVRNAARHARAKRIQLQGIGTAGAVTLLIHDDGVGLPPREQRGSGMGLHIMAHRARIIGAEFTTQRDPEGGTTVECRWPRPLRKEPAALP